jgi:hypothetical protein
LAENFWAEKNWAEMVDWAEKCKLAEKYFKDISVFCDRF